jgi:hypothetical protein
VNTNDFLKSPCATGLLIDSRYNISIDVNKLSPVNIYPSLLFYLIINNEQKQKQDETYNYEGQSDGSMCQSEIEFLLPTEFCDYETCSFDNAYQPGIKNAKFMVKFLNKNVNTTVLITSSFLRRFLRFSMQKVTLNSFSMLPSLNWINSKI